MASYNEPAALIEQNENYRTRKHAVTLAALAVILAVGILTAVRLGALAPTFNGKVDVAALQQDPAAYTTDAADGAAYIMVAENLAKTTAKNVCFSVVFNFRGSDTMGESFILIAALACSLCILREPKHAGEPAPAEGRDAGAQTGDAPKKRKARKTKNREAK